MKKITSILLAVILIISAFMIAACSSQVEIFDEPETTTVRIAAGDKEGNCYAFNRASIMTIRDLLENVKFSFQSSEDLADTVRLVKEGEAEMAMTQNDIADYVYNVEGFSGFSAMAACYPVPCQLVVSKFSEIYSLEDLAGKRISIGEAGSSSEFNAKQILEAYGVSIEGIDVQNMDYEDSVSALEEGEIDGFFCITGAPATSIMMLTKVNEARIVGISGLQTRSLIENHPYYDVYTIPANTYAGQEGPVMTVGLKTMYIVSNEVKADVVYDIVKAIFENKDIIAEEYVKGEELDEYDAVEGLTIPLHPGAKRYFEEIGVL